MNVCAGSMNMNRLINIQLISNLFFIVFAKQLPDNVIPQDYRLEIITNIGDEDDNSFNFKGSVLIHVSYPFYLPQNSHKRHYYDIAGEMRHFY